MTYRLMFVSALFAALASAAYAGLEAVIEKPEEATVDAEPAPEPVVEPAPEEEPAAIEVDDVAPADEPVAVEATGEEVDEAVVQVAPAQGEAAEEAPAAEEAETTQPAPPTDVAPSPSDIELPEIPDEEPEPEAEPKAVDAEQNQPTQVDTHEIVVEEPCPPPVACQPAQVNVCQPVCTPGCHTRRVLPLRRCRLFRCW